MDDEIKTLYLPPTKTVQTEKPRKKRVVTEEKRWVSNVPNQLNLLIAPFSTREHKNTIQQIHQKIAGYRYQDQHKELWEENHFITFDDVVDLLKQSSLRCYYCKSSVYLLYDFVRETKQWTLERLDNSRGHNRGNVVISCLGCNLRRRIMQHERFSYTKELMSLPIVKLLSDDDDTK
jgi:hypothetical protein